jgi:hypothetical protein
MEGIVGHATEKPHISEVKGLYQKGNGGRKRCLSSVPF